MTLAEQFGQNIRKLRESRGWTLDQVAHAAEMSKTGLWEIEKGANTPRIDTAAKIASVFKVSTGSLIDGELSEKPIVDSAIAAKIAELHRLAFPNS